MPQAVLMAMVRPDARDASEAVCDLPASHARLRRRRRWSAPHAPLAWTGPSFQRLVRCPGGAIQRPI